MKLLSAKGISTSENGVVEEDSYKVDRIEMGPFESSENNIEQRLSKAIKRLIVLCGGKPEAY